MLSIEWLVDESDTIAIVREPEKAQDGNPKILRCLKGKAESIVWPLIPRKTRWEDYKNCVPPSAGPVRILFIRGSSQLLQAVSLGRKRSFQKIDWTKFSSYEPIPIHGIGPTLYGVTQFGDLLLTESSLYAAIDARLKLDLEPVKLRENPYGVFETLASDLGVTGDRKFAYCSTMNDFPLAWTDDTYLIVVPFDTHRRDYFIKQLKTAPIGEKIYAIHQLAGMMDATAQAAIQAAVQSDEVERGYVASGVNPGIGPWNSVRDAALTALEIIDKQR